MKMSLTKIIFICMAIIPLMVQGDHSQIIRYLDRVAANDGNIKNVFQPSPDGCLGQGMSGLTYKGILMTKGIEIAMKFIPVEFEAYAKNERKAYAALGAVNNTATEAMGIPTLHYSGKWKNYFLLGITLLDPGFKNAWENDALTTIDKLIVFQEAVRISKYIHSCGVCHSDLVLNNIMFRLNHGFVIDYNLAIDTKGNMAVVNICAKRDWKKFLADMASTVGITVDWSVPVNPKRHFQNIEPEGLKRVFCKFADTTFDDAVLNYDAISNIISEEIENISGHPTAIVSWVSPEELFAGLTI